MEARSNTTAYARSTDAYPAGAKNWYGFNNHEVEQIAIQTGGAVTFSYRGASQDVEDVLPDDSKAHKILRDGQVIIVRGDKEYDLLGRRIGL